MNKTIKIAIADDHPLIIEGIQNMLRGHTAMEVVATYSNGKELIEGIKTTRPGVLFLDINLPDKQGDELSRIISRAYPEIRIIALTNLDNVYYIKSMLQNGASGYVLKRSAEQTSELQSRAKVVCRLI